MTLGGQVAATLTEHRRGGVQTAGHGIERRGSFGCSDDPRHDPLPEKGGPAKEHLSLVREVPEERALGDPGSLCDFGGRRLVKPSLGVESEGGLL